MAFAVLICAGVSSLPRVGQAQEEPNLFQGYEAGIADAAFMGTVFALDIGMRIVGPPGNPNQNPNSIDEAVRKALLWENPQTAALVSDIVLGTLLTSAFTGPFLEDFSLEGQAGNASLSGIEALLTVDLVTQVFKHLSSRQRPGAYFAGSDSHYNSFYSGHAAGAFASATVLTAYALEMDWMDDDLRWVIPTVSYASASLTAYLRVAADRHWLSDVLVGAAVGTGLSYMVLLIRPEFD